METQTEKTFAFVSAKAEIADLESLGWNFDSLYEKVANAVGVPFEYAKKDQQENYCIRIMVDEYGKTSYSRCQKKHLGEREFEHGVTGDDVKTLKDLETLFDQGKLWDVADN